MRSCAAAAAIKMGGGIPNCGYIASQQGILKAVTVVVGLIAFSWMMYEVSDTSKVQYYNKPVYGDKTQEAACKDVRKAAEALGQPSKPCPENFLLVFPIIIVSASFLSSAIMLVILLIFALNESGLFKLLDWIGHFVAGIALVVAGIMLIAWIGLAMNYRECKFDNEKVQEFCVDSRETQFGLWMCGIVGGVSIINGVVYLMAGMKIKQG